MLSRRRFLRRMGILSTSLLVLPAWTAPLGPSEISGRIVDEAGDPLPFSRITLASPDLDFFAETRSDSRGFFDLQGVPNETVLLGASRRGRAYQEREVEPLRGTNEYNFQLRQESHPGRWTLIGDTGPELLNGTGSGTLMATGEVIFCHDTMPPVVFDPESGETWQPAPSGSAQGCHVTTARTDGAVYFIGGAMGEGNPGDPIVKIARVYQRASNSWTRLADMNLGRWYPGIVRLPDERLLILGGEQNGPPGRTDRCEIYDPQADGWTLTGSMNLPVEMPPAVTLFNHLVLKTWREAELFDVASGRWRATGNFVQPRPGASRGDHSDHTIVHLPDGRVMAIGILPGPAAQNPSMVELYDPALESWSIGPSPRFLRQRPETMMLPDGKVIAFGGEFTGDDPRGLELGDAGLISGVTKLTDLYDPGSNAWRPLAQMNRFIHYHNVSVLLPDGRVLATAGAGGGSLFGDDPSIEAFEPPYLFRGVRPRIESISEVELEAGASVSLEVAFASAVTSVVLVGARAATHWIDGGPQRYLALPFNQQGSAVQAQLPSDAARMLPGQYLLFALVDDVPSNGIIVRVRGAVG